MIRETKAQKVKRLLNYCLRKNYTIRITDFTRPITQNYRCINGQLHFGNCFIIRGEQFIEINIWKFDRKSGIEIPEKFIIIK